MYLFINISSTIKQVSFNKPLIGVDAGATLINKALLGAVLQHAAKVRSRRHRPPMPHAITHTHSNRITHMYRYMYIFIYKYIYRYVTYISTYLHIYIYFFLVVHTYGMQVKDSCTVYKWYSIDLSHFPFPPLPTSSTGITPGCGGSDSIFVRTWRRGPGRNEDFLGFHWEGGKASNIYIYM